MKYELIAAQRASDPVTTLPGVSQVSRSAFCPSVGRKTAHRLVANIELGARIRAIHEASRSTYRNPHVHMALRDANRRAGRKCVAGLMRTEGLYGRRPRRWCHATESTHAPPVAGR